MFRHKTFMRKPFFSKATCSSTKKEFIHIPFPSKFRKMSRKKQKLSEKLLTGLVSMNIFTDTFQKVIKLTCRILSKSTFQNALSRCIMSNPLEDIFYSVRI